MPNWKKVIVSGSNASLNSLNVTAGITGSLFGTASWSINAITASYFSGSISNAVYAETASYALAAQNASDILIYVKNTTGAPITKGKVVRIIGSTGDNALIATASYEADNDSANTLGILNETIANDSFGYAMTEGSLIGINTNTFTAGQLLFLGPTGSIIGYEPIAPLHAVRLGQALRIQQIVGSMYVRIDNGYELDELHNVLIISGSDGDLLVASGSNGNGKKLYINSRQLTGSYGLTGSLTITGSTSTDLVRITQTGTGNAFVVEDSTNPDTSPFVINADGRVGIGNSTPAHELDIRSSAPQLRVYADANNRAFRIYPSIGAIESDNTAFYLNRVSTNNILLGIGGGNVGVGTGTPTAKLHVNNTASANSFLVEDDTTPDSTPFVIDNTGNVGIGTLTPLDKIHIISTSPDLLRIERDSGANSHIRYKNTVGQMWAGLTPVGNFAIGNGIDLTNYSQLTVVGTTGDVGVGTTTPNAKLHVYESNTLGTSSNNIQTIAKFSNKLGSVNSNNFRILARRLTDYTSDDWGQSAIRLEANVDDNITANSWIEFRKPIYPSTNNHQIVFGESLSTGSVGDWMIINNGNVGIGTSSPNAKLDVNGNTIITGSLTVTAGITGSLFGTASFATNAATASYVNPLVQNVLVTGNVGIGTTTPNYPLSISSSSDQIKLSNGIYSWYTSAKNNGDFAIASIGTRATLYLGVYSTQNVTTISSLGALTVSSSGNSAFIGAGNVGIGTNTPNAKLDVNGNAIITGSLTVSATGVNGILLDTDRSVGNSERSARLLFGQIDPTKSTSISAISGSMQFGTQATVNSSTGTTRMFISASGDVGIGTNQPTLAKLQVAGNVHATSFTGSLQGTASWSDNAATASYVANAFAQGGNSFGTSALLGTNDNQILNIETNGKTRLQFFTDGNIRIPSTQSMRPFMDGMYIDVHPEAANQAIVPYLGNDIAHNTLRGGTFTGTPGPGSTYVTPDVVIEAMFDGTPEYAGIANNSSQLSGSYTASIVFPESYQFTNTIGFSFGSPNWRAKDFTVEILVTGSYHLLDTVTNWPYANYNKTFNVGNNNLQGAIITFSNFNSSLFRIADIFLLNYNGRFGKEIYVGRDGGQIYKGITVTGSIVATAGFTGSLQGTASWASNAATASYVTPLTQSVLISGSLTVTGSININESSSYKQDGQNVIYIDKGTDSLYTNTVAGSNAGTIGLTRQTAVGGYAGSGSNGSNQTVFGYQSGNANSGSNQTAVGYQAGQLNSGSSQTAVGVSAGRFNSSGNQTAIGSFSGYYNTGVSQTAIGINAGQYNSGSNQTAVGVNAGLFNSASNQTAIGANAGRETIGVNQTAVGVNTGYLNNGNNQTALGTQAGQYNSGSNQVAVGYLAGYLNSGSNQVALGQNAGRENTGSNNTNIGHNAGYFTTGATVNTGSSFSVFLGSSTQAGDGNSTNQIVIGYNAIGIGDNSVVLGNSSIVTTALRGNVGIGTTSPNKPLVISHTGSDALIIATTNNTAYNRVILQKPSQSWSVGPNDNNAFVIGDEKQGVYKLTIESGSGHWAINSNGTGSVYIGASGTPSAKLHVNNRAATNSFLVEDSTNPDTTPFVITDIGNVGIGTLVPNAKLDVNGNAIITGSLTAKGTGATGVVLDTDTLGDFQSTRLFFKISGSGNDVSLRNNSGSLLFATQATAGNASGTTAMLISSSGDVSIGNVQPTLGNLQVQGNVYATSFTGSLSGSVVGNLTGTSSFARSSSYAITASNATGLSTLNQNVTISGSLTITNDLTILGSASIQYITSSQLNIFDNIISVNTLTPSIRFGGISVNDSGSSPMRSGSMLFDSQNNQWIFVHQNTPGGAITSSVLLMGPQTFNNIGNETVLTANRIPKGAGVDLGEHLTNSTITDTGTLVTIDSNTSILGQLNVTSGITGSLQGTASYYNETDPVFVAISGSLATTGSNTFVGTQTIQGLTRITGTSTNELVRITQTGTGDALRVEDSTNPDTTPFVIDATGNVGIGTDSPNAKLDVIGNVIISGSLNNGDTNLATGPYSHAEGGFTRADASITHAEGTYTWAQGIGAHAEGYATTASGQTSHAEGQNTNISSQGQSSHAEGYYTYVTNTYAHAEGNRTWASGQSSHAEGYATTASGLYSHAEGNTTQAKGEASHAEGVQTIASGFYSHAEGIHTVAFGSYSHAEGAYASSSANYSHAEGWTTIADGDASHAEGYFTTTSGSYSHAEGSSTVAIGESSHAEGWQTSPSGKYSHAEGFNTKTTINSWYSHAEGASTVANGTGSHAEGSSTTTSGSYSHAEGESTIARGYGAHAEGKTTLAIGSHSHAEGYNTTSSVLYSHAEGNTTQANGQASHAEGQETYANATGSHTEGFATNAAGNYSHAEGYNTTTIGIGAHSEGHLTVAYGDHSHTSGLGTVTDGDYQSVTGTWNISSSLSSAFIIGNGTSDGNRSNLVFATGSFVEISGSLTVSGSYNSPEGNTIDSNALIQASLLYLSNNF